MRLSHARRVCCVVLTTLLANARGRSLYTPSAKRSGLSITPHVDAVNVGHDDARRSSEQDDVGCVVADVNEVFTRHRSLAVRNTDIAKQNVTTPTKEPFDTCAAGCARSDLCHGFSYRAGKELCVHERTSPLTNRTLSAAIAQGLVKQSQFWDFYHRTQFSCEVGTSTHVAARTEPTTAGTRLGQDPDPSSPAAAATHTSTRALSSAATSGHANAATVAPPGNAGWTNAAGKKIYVNDDEIMLNGIGSREDGVAPTTPGSDAKGKTSRTG